MRIERFVVGSIETNAWLIESEGEAFLVDPGAEDQALLTAASQAGLVGVFLTHGHVDHIAGLRPFIGQGVRVFIGGLDAAALYDPRVNLSVWMGQPFSVPECVPQTLTGGETLVFGEMHCQVLHLPGHSPGSIGLLVNGHLFSGDVLFQSSIGRTDLPGGDFQTLQQSIRETLYRLPDGTIVHLGHGDDTTIRAEKNDNQYCRIEKG